MNTRNLLLSIVLLGSVVGIVYVLGMRQSDTTDTTASADISEADLNIFPYGRQPFNFKPIQDREKQTVRYPYPKLSAPETGLPYQNLFKSN